MSRPLRIEYPNAWYHVMNRGRRTENIFYDTEDYLRFLKILQEAVELWKIDICAYCLMPNHYHLLIRTPKANISRSMRHINSVYTQRFNRIHRTDGQLFRGRYKSILVGEETYLLELFRYICFNPVKAGIVDTPEDYRWSSYNDYMAGLPENKWVNRDLFLDWIVGKGNDKRLGRRWLGPDASDEIYEFFSKKNQRSIMGSQDFIDDTRRRFYKQLVHPEIPESKILELSTAIIIKEVGRFHGIDEKELYHRKRGDVNNASDMALYLIRTHTGQTLAEIGNRFNIEKYSSVSSAIQRFKQRLTKDPDLRKSVESVERDLIAPLFNLSQEPT